MVTLLDVGDELLKDNAFLNQWFRNLTTVTSCGHEKLCWRSKHVQHSEANRSIILKSQVSNFIQKLLSILKEGRPTSSHDSSSGVPAECVLAAFKEHLRNDDSLLREELTEEAGVCCPWGQKWSGYDLSFLSISYPCGFYKDSLSEAVYYYWLQVHEQEIV